MIIQNIDDYKVCYIVVKPYTFGTNTDKRNFDGNFKRVDIVSMDVNFYVTKDNPKIKFFTTRQEARNNRKKWENENVWQVLVNTKKNKIASWMKKNP